MYWMRCKKCGKKTPHYRKQYGVLKRNGLYEYMRYEDYWTCGGCGATDFKHPCQTLFGKDNLSGS